MGHYKLKGNNQMKTTNPTKNANNILQKNANIILSLSRQIGPRLPTNL